MRFHRECVLCSAHSILENAGATRSDILMLNYAKYAKLKFKFVLARKMALAYRSMA